MTKATTTTKRTRKSNKVEVVSNDAVLNDALAAIAPVSTDDTATDTDAVLSVIEAVQTATVDEVKSLRDRALAFEQSDVDTMIQNIRDTFAARDIFEASRGLDIDDKSSSYAKARSNMLKNAISVARGFLALDLEPVNVIRRKVVSSNEFSAKALDKVVEICAFICGNASRFQKVTQAFIACSIAVADKVEGAIDNKTNKTFLSSDSFDRLIADAELRDYLRDYQHKYMSGGTDTQSSQVRNVLDVLGLGRIVTVERARGGIEIDAAHGFYDLFRARYMTKSETVETVTA